MQNLSLCVFFTSHLSIFDVFCYGSASLAFLGSFNDDTKTTISDSARQKRKFNMTAMTNDRPRHTKSGLFKKALEPMDFANCDCRVTEWHQFDEKKRNRIWLCNVDNHLFQRHELMETGQVDALFSPPFHPYTHVLLLAVPSIYNRHITSVPARTEIVGAAAGKGCSFAGRCPWQLGELCTQEDPPWRANGESNWIRCHHPLDELLKRSTSHVQPISKGE